MIKAYRLYTGADGHSHVIRGTVRELDRDAVVSIHFKETAPHGIYDWHNAPERQYVITLSGELEFTMHDGSTFILRAGDVLLAQDTTGTAHKWRMLGDAPWRRAYVVLAEGSADLFEPDGTIPPAR
ncbi:MAG: cupin domain-containing protein [Flavobacteriales bacterium]|nr:cupin domain-containing protein [Flavobacteriales bacterium]